MGLWDNLEEALGDALDDLHTTSSKALEEQKLRLNKNLDQRRQDRLSEESVERLLSKPDGLANQTDEWLAKFVITLEGEIKRIEDKQADTAKIYGRLFNGGTISGLLHDTENTGFQESVHKRRVLLRHIAAVQNARKTSSTKNAAPPPTREEKRAACQERIRQMHRDKATDLDRLREDAADEDSVIRRDNMWTDAIRREENELAKLL
jgi:hypothetical protein